MEWVSEQYSHMVVDNTVYSGVDAFHILEVVVYDQLAASKRSHELLQQNRMPLAQVVDKHNTEFLLKVIFQSLVHSLLYFLP